ncbi:MAG: hypothetical protein A4E28_02066 [Methanocella sp. PtaU1.Bin125]|nr:MAG: hypothetical protein A4E28_02066 [Methanocella sp. PtaU1.Bin125]
MLAYHCPHCGKCWSYPVKKCIFCKSDTREVSETKYTVIGFTKVCVPSSGNERVPYFVYLIEGRNGTKTLLKSFHEYHLGHAIDLAGIGPQAVPAVVVPGNDPALR